jgi:hypothetical protein
MKLNPNNNMPSKQKPMALLQDPGINFAIEPSKKINPTTNDAIANGHK